MNGAAPASLIAVTVVYAPAPRELQEFALQLPDGACVADAVRATRLNLPSDISFGVWNHRASPEQRLRDQDRVEVYRPLRVDPKLARRERFARQGKRTAGLFARKPAAG